jgi:phosphocarrier protein
MVCPMQLEASVVNKLGLHARPAAEFVRCARTFKSTITLTKNGEVFSAASILDILSANLDCGSRVIIEAVGPDAAAALKRLGELMLEFKVQEESE